MSTSTNCPTRQANSVRRARKPIRPTPQRRKIWKRHHSKLSQLVRRRLTEHTLYAWLITLHIEAGELSLEFYPLDPNDTRPHIVLSKQSVYNLFLDHPTERMRRILGRYAPMLPVSA